MNPEFIDQYGTVGFFLRKLDLNTTSRVAMLASLLHLQSDLEYVKFDDFYQFSLDTTGEKLEESSFKSLISKMHKAITDKVLVESGDSDGDAAYRATELLVNLVEQGEQEFQSFLDQFVSK